MRLAKRLNGATVAVLATVTVVASSGVARADVVQNSVVSGGNDTIQPGGSTSISYTLNATDPSDPVNGCNATGSAPATVTPKPPSGVAVTPASRQLSGCGSTASFSFAAANSGDYTVPVEVNGGKTGSSYTTSGATFTLHVHSANTPPSVVVSGPTTGASYEKGSVPAAQCNVTDAQDGNSTFPASLSALTGALTSYGLGSQTASCSYTDAGGLNASASATYAIVDTTAPVLTVPGDISKEAVDASGAPVTWTTPAADAVDPAPSVTCNPAPGSTFPIGTTVVSCSAKDAAGNTTSKQFNVTVSDTTAPKLSLPSDITAEATGPAGADIDYTATATDAVDGAVTPSCLPTSGAPFALGVTPVNCTATDTHHNTSSGGFNVTIHDSTPPSLHLPGAQELEATGPDGAQLAYTATASDVVDGSDPVTCDSPSGTVFGLGTTTVSCSSTDAAGNLANGHFTVTVVDTTPPTLTLPAGITEEAASAAGADVAYTATAVDLVDGADEVDCTPANGTFPLGVTKVTCSSMDHAGNTANGSFQVTVTDTTPPTLNDVPGDQHLEATGLAGATLSYNPPTATDLVDGNDPVSCSPAPGSTFPLGTTTVTCSSEDAHHNSASAGFDVTVADTTPPTLHDVPGNQVVEATGPDGASATFDPPTATDLVDGTDPVSCDAISGATFALGVHTVICHSTDASGNTATASFTITVHDTTAPTITVPGNMTLEATGPSGAPATFSASATDTVDGNRPTACTPPSGSTFALGTTTVSCEASDLSSNTGHGGFTIAVQDTTPPAVTVPADITAEATSASGAAVNFTATATDIVDGRVPPLCTVAGGPVSSGNTFPLGATTVSCTATDAAGNTSTTKTFAVTIQDTTAPTLTVPSGVTAEGTSAAGAVVTYSASATDLVDGPVTPVCTPASGSTFVLGSTTVSCTASDAAGNTSGAKTFAVKVQDTTAPVLGTPGDITVHATSVAGAAVTFGTSATDLVDGALTPVCTPASGSTFAPGTTRVSCTATDTAGNSSAPQAFKVTVTFDFGGFLAPVDTNKVLNGMKAGSTAPLKWQVSNESGGYISALSVVNAAASSVVNCVTGGTTDDLTNYTTGSTSLRYDASANQYIYNWQSPKKSGSCYVVTIALTDGTAHSALFQLK